MNQLEVRSPFDNAIVASLPFAAGNQIELAVAKAVLAQAAWREVPLAERIARVREGLARFEANGEAIATDISRQMGKPIGQARGEVRGMAARANHMLSIAAEALAPERLPDNGFTRRIEHAPLGVVLHISAWNYPLLIAVNVVVPALLAGNTVLLKPSLLTPLSGQAFADAFGDLMVPDVLQNLIVTNEQAERLITDPRIGYVAFTGSVASGRKVYRAAASRLLGAGLELGGKDPAYVAADADLAFAIENVVDGACYNAGQSCCAVERVYVHKSVHDEFVAGATALMGKYQLGDPFAPETTMGPLARAAALDELEHQVSNAVHGGAKLVLGGTRSSGNFFPPTVLTEVPNASLIMQEESFGPTLPILAVDDDEDALAKMEDSRFGLTASVWTTNRQRAEWFGARLSAGTIYQNRCDYLDPALPWTGWRESGLGSTLSRYGFHHLTRRKAIHFRD